LFRAKNAAIFNLYNVVVIYNSRSGKFRLAIQHNPRQDPSSLPSIALFPDGLDYLINSGSTLQALYYEKPTGGWERFTINHPNKDYLLLTFDRLGRCIEPQAGMNYGVQIYLQNQKVFRKYRYNYVIYVSSGGNIKLIRIRS
jgi:hypothetical protein